MPIQSQTSLPIHWIYPFNEKESYLYRIRNQGQWSLAITDDKTGYFIIPNKIESNFNADSKELVFFQTALGLIGIDNAKELFSTLSDIAFSDDYSLNIETWLRVSVLNLPNNFLKIWQYFIPCSAPINQRLIPIELDITSDSSIKKTVLWAQIEIWKDVFNSKKLKLTKKIKNKYEDKLISDLLLMHLDLKISEFKALEPGDILIPNQFLFTKDGNGKINLIDKEIDVTLLNNKSHWQLRVNSIRTINRSNANDESIHYINNLSISPNFLELTMSDKLSTAESSIATEKSSEVTENSNEGKEKSSATNEYNSFDDHKKPSLSCAKVTIDACLGSFEINYSIIDELQQGDLINLKENYAGAISLRNHGIEIGIAKIVSVNDKFSLQIDKLWR